MYNVGSIIKSYDFLGRTDCYFVGVVEKQNTDDDTVTCRTVKQVFRGVECEKFDPHFTTPIQGAALMDDEFPRVIVLGE